MNYNVTIKHRPTAAELAPVLDKISATLRKYLASDRTDNCLEHARLGQDLLRRQGIQSEVHIGWAAWRVSENDFVTTHCALADLSTDPLSIFHAFLFLAPDKILDFTLYQLPLKISPGMTISWQHPPYLFISQNEVSPFRDVCSRRLPGVVYYQRVPMIEAKALAEAQPLSDSEFEDVWRFYSELG
jgi:Transglutaminase-like superfamily